MSDPVLVEFDRATQSLGALREAAYRLIGTASCHIDSAAARYVCCLTPAPNLSRDVQAAELRSRFLDLVTDENLREKVSAETAGVRNVILALAFGALADEDHAGRLA
jgi:His-Xaa-Ser system protein HxsD